MDDGLQRVEAGTRGIRRRVAGRGFGYVSTNGRKIASERLLVRINSLAIPRHMVPRTGGTAGAEPRVHM